ncbi:MAG: glutathione S-transferase family protein [Proteobacteria bacterium]|nr:glutathione S-transferase family protein [Pseudomonadota bacterium]
MEKLALILGNKNYSSWSMRAWLALKRTGADFAETVIPLRRPETKQAISAHSPSGLVPVLRHGDVVVWDSLAISEYLAELFPEAGLWPEDPGARAEARAVSAEMHAGFAALRRALPMNVRARLSAKGRNGDVDSDIRRISGIWETCLDRHGGEFLFGPFTIADAMFAPVVSRFRTYRVDLPRTCRDYADAVWDTPEMRDWTAAAETEPHAIPDLDGP